MRGIIFVFACLLLSSLSAVAASDCKNEDIVTLDSPMVEQNEVVLNKIDKEEFIEPSNDDYLYVRSNEGVFGQNFFNSDCYCYKNRSACKIPKCQDMNMKLVYSYLEDNQNLKALDLLKLMPEGPEVSYAKALAYYNLEMYSDAKEVLKGSVAEKAQDLYYKIKKARALTLTPSYTFLNQELSEVYDLDVRKVGISLSAYGAKNSRAFLDYNMYVYVSGNYNGDHLTDFTNEIRGGVEGRFSEKFAHRVDLGVKAFQNGGAMLNTDSWVKYYANDSINYTLGFKRNNAEQSYLAAVGVPLNGVFTGRVAYNKAYGEINGRFNKNCYYMVNVGGGVFTAQTLPTNAFVEGTLIVGKEVYKNSENRWFQKAALELMSYNASYQQSLLNISAPFSYKRTIGGYFSPSFTTAEAVNFRIEGENKKMRLRYGVSGYAGGQVIYTPDQTAVIYGILPYVSWDVNEHVSVNLSYAYTNFSTFLRHYAYIGVDIKLFKKRKN